MLHEVSAGESGEVWSEALERGRIVRFARCPVELPNTAASKFEFRPRLTLAVRGLSSRIPEIPKPRNRPLS